MSLLYGADEVHAFGKPYPEYAKTLSTEELVDLIYCLECLIGSEYLKMLEFGDTAILMHDALRDECVRRLELIACGTHDRVDREAEEEAKET